MCSRGVDEMKPTWLSESESPIADSPLDSLGDLCPKRPYVSLRFSTCSRDVN